MDVRPQGQRLPARAARGSPGPGAARSAGGELGLRGRGGGGGIGRGEGGGGAAQAARTGHTGFDAYTGRSALEAAALQWRGTRDLSAFLAVPAAIDFLARHDWPSLGRRCHEMALELQREVLKRGGLAPIAPDGALAQMVPIPVRVSAEGGAAEALRRWLFDERRIEVPVTLHAGRVFVRVSVPAYNTRADLERLRDALAEAGV
ncbi:MAG: hypothetical protein U1F49_12815 [Rubrivivax sp.]